MLEVRKYPPVYRWCQDGTAVPVEAKKSTKEIILQTRANVPITEQDRSAGSRIYVYYSDVTI